MMDDVDRLFECFKCGVTPPKSAIRERRKGQKKFKNGSLRQGEMSALVGSSPPGQSRQTESNSSEKNGPTEITPSILSRRKQISPLVFYGSPHGLPTKRPKRLLQLLHEIRNDLSEEDDLNSRKVVWSTFPKQDQAIQFAKKHSHVYIFSYQDHLNGQRRFLVSTHKEFWQRYKKMDSKFRHHYEVIQEALPCHLYFDLEFDKRFNADKNGEEMVDILISVIFEVFFDKYSIRGNLEWIVELDSSTEEKFSRHLIIRIPETAFKDNSHAGAFVAEVCSRICSARQNDQRLEKLFILKDSCSDEFPPRLFVDTAVYSRNRCFRLALSSKAGKSSVLLPTGRFKCKTMSEEEMFMESLICKIDADSKKLLICKLDSDCMKTLCFNTELNNNNHGSSGVPLALATFPKDMPETYLMGKSPFPALDTFIKFIASTGNVSGKIRSWYWFSDYGLMIYSMSRNRFCERIGREHKSNHVMYIVDFKRAVYYQKCYDPDCKGYRSPMRPIPMDAVPDIASPSQTDGCRSICNSLDGNNSMEQNSCGKELSSCNKSGWWFEAVKVADDIESRRKAVEKVQPVPYQEIVDDDDDYDWWMAVERTASQAEQQRLHSH